MATGIRLYSKDVPAEVIMERSGHLSVGGVQSYECTTELQKKEISIVRISNCPLKVLNSAHESTSPRKKAAKGKENGQSGKAVSLQDLQGCTLNFIFNYAICRWV